MRVLVVDDEAFLAELVKLALEADGHACYTAGSIDEAAEIVRQVRLDLVALDLIDGGRSPLEWVEEVVLAFPELHGRIFVLASRPLGETEALRIGGCGARVMPKPFTLHGLRRAVTDLGELEGDSGNPPARGGVPYRPRPPVRPLPEDS